MTHRPFHIGDVLTITTGKLVSPRLIEGVYDILNFMVGESIYTHQIPAAMRECAPALLAQHPQLADVSGESVNRETFPAWLAEQVERFGETLLVAPLAPRDPAYDTPIADLIEMVGDPTKIVVVDP